jgi:hypothetical protein
MKGIQEKKGKEIKVQKAWSSIMSQMTNMCALYAAKVLSRIAWEMCEIHYKLQ